MPKGSAVDEVEQTLKSEASKKGFSGKRAGKYIYGTLNNIGLKKGNKTTAKGMKKAKSDFSMGSEKDSGNFLRNMK